MEMSRAESKKQSHARAMAKWYRKNRDRVLAHEKEYERNLSLTKKNRRRARLRIWQRAFRKTPKGRVFYCWHNMLLRCRNPKGKNAAYKHVRVRMSKEEFLAWAVPAFAAFVKEHPGLRPSIDRKDSAGDYTLSNIQISDLGRNSATRRNARVAFAPTGTSWCSGCRAYLPVGRFHKNKHRASGCANYCKQCKPKRI